MLSKAHKLNSVEFTKVFNEGKKLHTTHFMVSMLPQTEKAKGLQAAVVVSKKISKLAVKRVLLRRKIFAALREHKGVPYQLVFMLKAKGYTPFRKDELINELGEFFKKLK